MEADVILPASMLSFFRRYAPDLEQHIECIERASRTGLRYPDGSLQLEANATFDVFGKVIRDCESLALQFADRVADGF